MVLAEQCRVPAGRKLIECPAGMVDDSLNLKSVVLQEIKEECGLEITLLDLHELGSAYTSPGG